MDDLLLVPTRNVKHSEKYQDVMKYLKENPDVKRLVFTQFSISSGQSHKSERCLINTPAPPMPHQQSKEEGKGSKTQRRLDYRNPSDVVSMLDGYAETSNLNELNPFDVAFLHKFCSQWLMASSSYHKKFSNGIYPNTSIKI